MNDTKRPPNRVVGPTGLMPVLTEWWEELNWPRIFGAARQGLRPGRLGLAFFAIIVCALLFDGARMLDMKWFAGTPVVPDRAWADEELTTVWRHAVEVPLAMAKARPLTTFIAAPLALAAWLLAMGAICRMAACEMCLRQSIGWTDGLGFSLQRLWSLVGAVVGPLVIIWVVGAGLAVAGWALLHAPWLNLVGSIAYPLFLIAGLVAVLVAVGYALGGSLLTPAVACEGTDAIDAIQRAYTYLFAKPGRLILYLIAAAAGTLILGLVITILVRWSIGFAAQGAAVWAGDRGSLSVWRATLDALAPISYWPVLIPTAPADDSLPWRTGTWLLHFWTQIPVILVLAAWASCSAAAATGVYLGMRRVCDGQDWAELWVPGMIPGTMAQTMDARAKIAAAAGVPQSELDEAEEV